MSISYSIAVRLHASYSEENILKILECGKNKRLIYFDYSPEQGDGYPLIIDFINATKKVMKALKDKLETGPSVYVTAKDNSCFHLWFYQNEDGSLEMHIGAFGNAKKKDGFLDFSYYIRMALDLCEYFPLAELKTEIY